MANDRPTGSITGQRDWEWNRWQAVQQSRNASTGDPADQSPSHDQRGVDRQRSYREQVAALQREIRDLETDLERTERRFQYVIDHYERLLAEKDRQLATRTATSKSESDTLPARLTSVLRRVTDRYQ